MIYNSNEQLVTELKKLLLDTKCSQRDIAKQMGISPQALQNLLNKKQLSFADLKRVLDCINCDYWSIFLLDQFPQSLKNRRSIVDISKRYSIELNKISNHLVDLERGHTYELTNTSGTPSCATLAQHLKEDIASLLEFIGNDKPGVDEKVVEASRNI